MNDERIIHGLDALPDAVRGCALTIGNFDGVHLGHQRILREVRRLADADGVEAVAMTFDPFPDVVFHPEHARQCITPPRQRAERLCEAGADRVVVVPPDRELLGLSPEKFVCGLLAACFAPRHVVEGRDFAFGARRAGTVDTLREFARPQGFEVHVVEEVMLDLDEGPDRISSTLVRMLLRAGRIEDANRCLARRFALYGDVIPGAGHGRLLEFPTANIAPSEQVVPADGVYAGVANIDDQAFPSAVSIGNKPTLGPADETYVEAFLIDAEGDYYGRPMRLELARRLRDQATFPDADALQEQIAKDVQHVRKLLRQDANGD